MFLQGAKLLTKPFPELEELTDDDDDDENTTCTRSLSAKQCFLNSWKRLNLIKPQAQMVYMEICSGHRTGPTPLPGLYQRHFGRVVARNHHSPICR